MNRLGAIAALFATLAFAGCASGTADTAASAELQLTGAGHALTIELHPASTDYEYDVRFRLTRGTELHELRYVASPWNEHGRSPAEEIGELRELLGPDALAEMARQVIALPAPTTDQEEALRAAAFTWLVLPDVSSASTPTHDEDHEDDVGVSSQPIWAMHPVSRCYIACSNLPEPLPPGCSDWCYCVYEEGHSREYCYSIIY